MPIWIKLLTLGLAPLAKVVIEAVAKARRDKREQEARLAKGKLPSPRK